MTRAERPFRERYSFLIILLLFALIASYAFVSQLLFATPLFLYVFWFGFDIILVNVQGAKRAISARAWPTTTATLLSGRSIRKEYSSSPVTYRWFLELDYCFEVDGQLYESDNYNWVGVAYLAKEKVDQIVDNLGDQFEIRYNPDLHGESVVVPTVSPIYLLGMLIGIAVMAGGAIGLLDFFEFLDAAELVAK